jgi:glutamate-1-semialdehyde 2,1-aminomutase
MTAETIAGISTDRLAAFAKREADIYAKARPKALKALTAGAGTFLGRVPMHWMADWPMPHLPLVAKARGAQIEDIDGIKLDDFCLGDTGSM